MGHREKKKGQKKVGKQRKRDSIGYWWSKVAIEGDSNDCGKKRERKWGDCGEEFFSKSRIWELGFFFVWGKGGEGDKLNV